jgi:hypothetical protein
VPRSSETAGQISGNLEWNEEADGRAIRARYWLEIEDAVGRRQEHDPVAPSRVDDRSGLKSSICAQLSACLAAKCRRLFRPSGGYRRTVQK